MKPSIRLCLILLLLAAVAAGPVAQAIASALAARGAPGSPEFGFGATLYPDGLNLNAALTAAGDLDLDWLRVPIAWDALQPEPGADLRPGALDTIMQYAGQQDIPVMISLSRAPAWAQTPQGPDPALAAALVETLAARYPALLAVELFPGANTTQGWGAPPSPAAYMALLSAARARLQAAGSPVILAAGGLQPQKSPPASGSIDDLAFLRELYQQGAADLVNVISIQYPVLLGSPLDAPTPGETRVFRHYESVRQVMIENHHATGRIWVTQISPTWVTINDRDSADQQSNSEQSSWLIQGYTQLRGQLYVGVGFLQGLNMHPGEGAAPEFSLMRGSDDFHPFYATLREMIALNQAGSAAVKPGKAKGGYLEKQRP